MNKIILALSAALAAVASVKVPEVNPLVMGSILAGVEMIQRLFKTTKPLSYIYGLGEVAGLLGLLLSAAGEKLKKASDALPQRVQE